MKDEIIEEVWQAKDAIAAEHHYDIDALVRYLCDKESKSTAHVVDLKTSRDHKAHPHIG